MNVQNYKNPLYLVVTGSLLALTVSLSKAVSADGVAIIWFLSFALLGGGLLLLSTAALKGWVQFDIIKSVLLYSIGAGLFHALPNTLAYASVIHVGAGFVTLAYAFPLLVTYLMSLAIGLDKLDLYRLVAVICALIGGLLIASAKFGGLQGEGDATYWVLMACSIPFIIALGNIYRTRYWPKGAKPLILASLMLILASFAIMPFALFIQGVDGVGPIFSTPYFLIMLIINMILFALQFVFYFKLQLEAGPVYLSQIGSVSAAVGTPIGVLYFGEVLPDVFIYAIILIVIGVVLFQKPFKA